MGLFRKSIPYPRPPAIQGSIRVSKEGTDQVLSIPEFEAVVEAAFIPQLDYADMQLFEEVVDTSCRFRRAGKLSRRQLWLGSYFRKEIELPLIPEVTIRWIDSSIGWGVFANRSFKQMEYVAEYCGKLRRRRRDDKKNAYCFEYAIAENICSPYLIDARDQGGIGRLINHSDSPNLVAALATVDSTSRIILITKQSIPRGAQLFYDYGCNYWAHRSKPKKISELH